MRKKIVLYLICFLIALVVLHWVRHEYFPPGTPLARRHLTPTPVQTGVGASHLVIETRNARGILLYVLRCRHATPEGHGRYRLVHPQIQFYGAHDQSVRITGQTGDMVVDQIGGPLSGKIYPRRGTLAGHPTITLGPTRSFTGAGAARRPGQLQIRLAGPVHFDYQTGLVTSAGSVRLRSDRMSFNGAGLTAEINVRTKRLEYLQIARGHRLVVRNISAATAGVETGAPRARHNAASRARTNRAAPSTSSGQPLAEKLTQPTATVKQLRGSPAPAAPHPSAAVNPSLTVYQLTFGQHVQVALGNRTLQAHRLRILFAQTLGLMPSASPPSVLENAEPQGKVERGRPRAINHATRAPTTGTRKPETRSQVPTTISPASLRPIGPHDLVVTWRGPLVIRPAPPGTAPLVNARDVRLRASGRAGHPVIMHDAAGGDGSAAVVAYDTATELLTMRAAGLSPLTFRQPKLGHITCRYLTYARRSGRLSLRGPGHWRLHAAAAGGTWTGSWLKTLRLVLSPAGGGGVGQEPAKLFLRRIAIAGKVEMQSRGLTVHAATLQANIVRTTNPRQPQALSSLQAQGDVRIVSQTGVAGGARNRLACQWLVVTTARAPLTGLIEPAHLRATGQVTVALRQAAKRPHGVAPRYLLTAANLRAALVAAPRQAARPATMPMGHYQVTRFRAWGDMKLHLLGAGRPILATGYALQANNRTGTAVLTTDPSGKNIPMLRRAGDELTAAKILLRRQGQQLATPGPGTLTLWSNLAGGGLASTAFQPGALPHRAAPAADRLLPAGGKVTRPRPGAGIPASTVKGGPTAVGLAQSALPRHSAAPLARVRLAWRGHMAFAGAKGRADFYGGVAAQLIGQPGRSSSLRCRRMTVYFSHTGRGARHLVRLVAVAPAAGAPVIARDASFTPAGQLRTQLYLRCRRLDYNAVTNRLRIPVPGHMLLEDFATPKNPHGNALLGGGRSALSWRRLLQYNVRQAIISMHGHVRLVYQPLRPLPTLGGKSPYRDPNSGLVLMRARILRVQLSQSPRTTVAEPVLGGAGRLAAVNARNATLELMGLQLAAQKLQFSAIRQQAVAESAPGGEVVLSDTLGRVHGEARKIIWNLAQGRSGLTFIQPHGLVTR